MLIATERNRWKIYYVIYPYMGKSRICGMSIFQTTGHDVMATHDIYLMGPDQHERKKRFVQEIKGVHWVLYYMLAN